MASWSPLEDVLENYVNLLRATLSHDNVERRYAEEQLSTLLSERVDHLNYLVYVFCHLAGDGDAFIPIRRAAGVDLKNIVRNSFAQLSSEIVTYLQSNVSTALGDSIRDIRNTASTVIAGIVAQAGYDVWPGLLDGVFGCLAEESLDLIDGAVDLFRKLSEDDPRTIAAMKPDSLSRFFPALAHHFQSPYPTIRKNALLAIIQYVEVFPVQLANHIGDVLQGLGVLVQDTDASVLEMVCRFFTLMLRHEDYILTSLSDVMEFIMYCMTLPTESVAMAACDFWPCVVEIDQGVNLTIEYASRLIPIVFDCLKYSEFELSLIRKDLEGTASTENIDPSMYMAHARVEGDDDDDDDDEAAENFLSGKNWNVRKCAAASLDVICGYCGSPIYHVTMHEISVRLMNEDWLVREAALLGLGAIADGAMEDIAKDLPTVFPTILEYVSDPQPAISVIACWVLSQYATWAADESDRQTFFEPMLRVLIELTVSPNKLIQDAACSALGTVQESVRAGMGPYVDVLLEAYLGVFGRYKKRNMVVLLDSISTLAESSTTHFSQSPHLSALCDSLQRLWDTIKVSQHLEAGESTRIIDILYCPLLECWASVCRSAGQNLPPATAEFVFNRSLFDWNEGIQVCSSLEEGGELDDIEEVKDVVVCCIDLVSAVVHAMGAGLEEVVARSSLIDLLTYSFDDFSHEVRQNAYALCGDIAKNIFGRLLPFLDHIVTKLVEGLDMGSQSMCNNASWALGEIIMVAGEAIAAHAPLMLEAFIACLEVDDIRPSLHHNLCVSIGRLGSACPEVVAPFLTRFFVTWCQSMKGFKQQPEKHHAFQGIIRCIHTVGVENLMEDFPYFVESCSMYRDPSADMRDAILELVRTFKGMAGDYWNQMMMEFTPLVKDNLRVRFGIE